MSAPYCLVVDDSRVVRRVAVDMLKSLGFAVAEAEDGLMAVQQCTARVPDFILLDWNMPEMDGITCLTRLRAMDMPHQPRVILCTTENTLEKIGTALAAGADEYIIKPFDRDILRDKLVQIGLEQAA